MFTLALALSFIQPADACAMPRYEAPRVAKAEPTKAPTGKAVDNRAAVDQAPEAKAPATLEDALAEIDGAAVIPEVPVAPPTPADANKQAAAVEPRS